MNISWICDQQQTRKCFMFLIYFNLITQMHAFRIWVRKCCIGSSLLLRSASRYRLFSLRFYIWSLRDCKQRDFLTIFIIFYFWILNDLFKSMIVFSCHKRSRIDCVKCVFEPSWAPTTENEGSFIQTLNNITVLISRGRQSRLLTASADVTGW